MSAAPGGLAALLAGPRGAWPAPVEHAAELPSTSDRAKDLAREGAREWTVVLADRQLAGRGRHGRPWVSPPGNVFLSVVLRPRADVRVALLPLLAGVAVAEALELEAGLPASLKWPNDVQVRGRKVGGILVEGSTGGAGMEWAVVGIGVNLRLGMDELPPELASLVTSVAAEGGRETRPVVLAAAVLRRLAVWYPARATGDAAPVREAWLRRCLPWWDRTVEARSGDRAVRGVARGLDEWGGLLLEREDGSLETLRSGEVREVHVSDHTRP